MLSHVRFANKTKRKRYGEISSKFCGSFRCESCIVKKRKDPQDSKNWEEICKACEESYIKREIIKGFLLQQNETEKEIDSLKSILSQTINNIEAEKKGDPNQARSQRFLQDTIERKMNVINKQKDLELRLRQEEDATNDLTQQEAILRDKIEKFDVFYYNTYMISICTVH